MPPTIWRLLAAFGRIVVAATLLYAVVHAYTQFTITPLGPRAGPAVLAAVIERHAVLPTWIAQPLATCAVFTELLIGLWLLSHRATRGAAVCAGALLLVFTGYLLWVFLARGNEKCGCFGAVRFDTIVSAFVRNSLLLLLLMPSLLRRSSIGETAAGTGTTVRL